MIQAYQQTMMRTELERLREENAELRKDAERMNALEASKACNMWIVSKGKDSFTVALKSPYGNCVTRQTLREAIDAAIQTHPKETP